MRGVLSAVSTAVSTVASMASTLLETVLPISAGPLARTSLRPRRYGDRLVVNRHEQQVVGVVIGTVPIALTHYVILLRTRH
jgi:hypothetical protein